MDSTNTINRLTSRTGIATEDIDIRGLFSVIWDQKNLLMAIIIIGTLLTLTLSMLVNTKYTARSEILIYGDNKFQSLDVSTLGKALSIDIGFILTEIEVLKSRTLVEKVIKKLNLQQDLEFNTGGAKKDLLNTSSLNKIAEQQSGIIKTATVDNFKNALSVSSIPGSLAVKVSFTSKDPVKAALITNGYVEEYINQRATEKQEEQLKLGEWLDKRVEDLRQQVLDAETKAEEYRALNNLAIGRQSLLSSEELSSLKSELIEAKANYLNLKTQVAQMNKNKEATFDTKASFNSINSNLIKNLSIERLALETNISELSNRYGPKHPVMIEKQAELAEIKNKIDQQAQISKQSLKNDLAIAKAQMNEIEKNIKRAAEQTNVDNNAMITLRELEREAAASNAILKTFLEKYKRNIGKDTLQDPGARIISYANVPDLPSSPDRKLILALGIFVSFVFGLAIIFLNSKLYNKFKSADALERFFGIPCLGNIPSTRSGWNKNLVGQVLSNPLSPMVEAIRNLRMGIKNQKTQDGEDPKVISMLSSVQNEGKTTIAVIMAQLAAKAGERVILIDANLRTPEVHTALELSNNSNLVDYLTDQKELKDVIYKDKDTNLDIIFGNSVPNNAFNLLSMNKLDVLIAALRQNYDLIIIDTPACLNASDGRLIEQLSDLSLYSVKFNATRDKTVSEAIKPFLHHTHKKLSFVLTYTK